MNANQLRLKLLQSLDHIIKNGRWEGNLFLKNILKKLEQMRADLSAKVASEELELLATPIDSSLLPREGYELVYIEIYQAACENLDSWLTTIKNLSTHYVSRPIYRDESYVQELVRSKRSRTDGYVIVWVKSSDIVLQPGVRDRFSHELVKLKENSIEDANIVRFVHDKIVYNYTDSNLIINRGEHAGS